MILMDQRMPGMDGSRALHLIREQEDGCNRETPVICLTADAIAGARERYLAEGFTDYLSKPVSSLALRRMLLQHLPKEKIIPVTESEPEEAAPPAEDSFAALRAAEIDITRGLSFCQGDDALYRSVLWEYGCSAGERTELLQQYFSAADWKNYAIQAHALKSTSGTIGAGRLSDLAASLEQAARQEDTETLREGHEAMLSLYSRTAEAILSVCTGDTLSADENDGIIEFGPEE